MLALWDLVETEKLAVQMAGEYQQEYRFRSGMSQTPLEERRTSPVELAYFERQVQDWEQQKMIPRNQTHYHCQDLRSVVLAGKELRNSDVD